MKQVSFALVVIGMAAVVSANVMAANPYTSPEAIAALRERAAAGDVSAIYELGYTLQNDPDESNDVEGRDLMVEAANRGYWISAAQLGQYYLYGWADWAKVNHEANTAEAIRWLRRAGEMAPPEEDASYTYSLLGNLYSHTFMRQVDWTVAPLDETEAIKWYRLCTAAEGNPCAGDLGRLLVKTPSGITEGIKWLLVGANNGNGWAMRDLGGLYADGKILRQDLVTALAWYRRAAAWTPAVSEGNDLVLDVSRKAEELAKQLTPEEIQRANDMVAQFKPKLRQ
jgi:TPR repeat protein